MKDLIATLAAMLALFVVMVLWLGYPIWTYFVGASLVVLAYGWIDERNRKPKGKQE